MQIYRHISHIPEEYRGCVIALGNFDGLHRGHQSVIGRASALACQKKIQTKQKTPVGVLTFEPHPRGFFRPEDPAFCLTPFNAKAHQLQALGLDMLVNLSFDQDLASLSPQEFIDQILVEGLAISTLVVGYDFKFGKGRGGDVKTLMSDTRFETHIVEAASAPSGEIYSSTNIRDYLKHGEPGHAAALLGRPFEIEGTVLKGAQIGRTIGFPTANLDLGVYIRPAYGVYAVRVSFETDQNDAPLWYDGIANLGIRPTVDGMTEKFETHLFDLDQDLYGIPMRVALIEFIRTEQKFETLDALKEQITKDCHAARIVLNTRAAGA